MKSKIKDEEITRRKKDAVKSMAVMVFIIFVISWIALQGDASRFLVTFIGVSFITIFSGCLAIERTSRNLRTEELQILESGVVFPTHKGTAYFNYEKIIKVEIKSLQNEGTSAIFSLKGHPKIRVAGLENMLALLNELQKYISPDKIVTITR